MTEFKLKEFPGSVKELADVGVSILKIDSGVKWTVSVETEGWDSHIIFKQEDWKWLVSYSAGDKLTQFFSDVSMVYYHWDRDRRRKVEVNNANQA